jgi:hypothetical protein
MTGLRKTAQYLEAALEAYRHLIDPGPRPAGWKPRADHVKAMKAACQAAFLEVCPKEIEREDFDR